MLRKIILVTGGAGYIGSVLVRKLLAYGYKVRVLDKLMFGVDSIKGLLNDRNFELIKGDILDTNTLKRSIRGAENILHLAGARYSSGSVFKDTREDILKDYLIGKILVNAAKDYGIRRFIFASSCSVYEGKQDSLSTESSLLKPSSLYAKNKLKVENYILRMSDAKFVPTILRIGTVYGWSMCMRFDLVLNRFIMDALRNKKILLFDGEQWRPFIHCLDVAGAFIKALQSSEKNIKSEIFNIGNSTENYQIMHLAKIVTKFIPCTIINRPSKDKRSYRIDFSKSALQINFKTNYCIKDGIKEIKTALS